MQTPTHFNAFERNKLQSCEREKKMQTPNSNKQTQDKRLKNHNS